VAVTLVVLFYTVELVRGKWVWNKYVGEIADLLRKHGGKTGEELKAEGK